MTGDGRLRCLWLSRDVPYPALSGRRVYSAGLSDALAGRGVEVHGLGAEGGASLASTLTAWSHLGPSSSASVWRRMASRWPAMVVNCRTPAYRQAVRLTLRRPDWDVVIIDHLQMAWVLPDVLSAGLPVVYVSHNHEASTRRDVARHTPWRSPVKAPLAFDSWRVQAAERLVVDRSALVTAVTSGDAERFRADGARHVLVLEPGHPAARARSLDRSSGERTVVMLTNLEWHVKRRNLLRFLHAADDVFGDAGIQLRIVGPAPQDFVIRQRHRWRSARFVGPVDDLVKELVHARVGLVSEPDGGGFKLKSLDYIFNDLPMAVLDGSVDGLPLRPGVDHAVASTERALACEVVRLIDEPAELARMAGLARARCAPFFDWSARGEALEAALRVVLRRDREARVLA